MVLSRESGLGSGIPQVPAHITVTKVFRLSSYLVYLKISNSFGGEPRSWCCITGPLHDIPLGTRRHQLVALSMCPCKHVGFHGCTGRGSGANGRDRSQETENWRLHWMDLSLRKSDPSSLQNQRKTWPKGTIDRPVEFVGVGFRSLERIPQFQGKHQNNAPGS